MSSPRGSTEHVQRCGRLPDSAATGHAGCEEAVALAHAEWRAAMDDLAARMADLNDHWEREGVFSSPAQELHRLLALGDVSPGMHQYLTATLGACVSLVSLPCMGALPRSDADSRTQDLLGRGMPHPASV